MDIRENHSWMYNRLMPGRKGYTDAFVNEVDEFVSFACQEVDLSSGKIRCPCSKYKNLKFLDTEEVKVHLYRKGFIPNYWYIESDPAAHGIAEILKSRDKEPWTSWKKIPIKTREQWFGEFLAEFTRTLEELTQQALTQGTPPPCELDVWCDIAGLKKGKAYGLGMESTVLVGRPCYRGSSSTSAEWVQREELEQLRKQVEEVRNERDELRDRVANAEKIVEHKNRLMQELIESINRQPIPPTFESSHDEDDGDRTQPPSAQD